MKFYGQNALARGLPYTYSTRVDQAGGGGGYYGGEGSVHCNGGAAGGSAYADITGNIKQVTSLDGYSGDELRTESDPLKGNFGNGEVKITKQ